MNEPAHQIFGGEKQDFGPKPGGKWELGPKKRDRRNWIEMHNLQDENLTRDPTDQQHEAYSHDYQRWENAPNQT